MVCSSVNGSMVVGIPISIENNKVFGCKLTLLAISGMLLILRSLVQDISS